MKLPSARLFLVIIIGAGILTAGGFILYQRYVRGALPAITPPPEDITKVINTTGMPLKLPPGFSISIFAKDLESPRVLTLDPAGTIVASITSEGSVVALPDQNSDGVADETVTVTSGLNRPHGLAFDCADTGPCNLYIAETHRISIFSYDKETHRATFAKKIADLPNDGGHFTRTLGFGPDPSNPAGQAERLYVSIGSSCNVCNEKDERRAKIFSMQKDGSDFKEYARGLRNSVFFTWNYVDGRMWATEMGRDLLGDNIPPDEINIINEGANYGWPTCYGKNVHDTAFDKNTYIRNPCMEPFEAPSFIDLQAHSAPLGLAFIPEDPPSQNASEVRGGWPEEYWYNLIVAFHGSWNRTEPTGYKLARIKLDAKGNYLGIEDFITGWLAPSGVRGLTPEGALGRPVDILIRPGGIMYISDDKAGAVYRISHIK